MAEKIKDVVRGVKMGMSSFPKEVGSVFIERDDGTKTKLFECGAISNNSLDISYNNNSKVEFDYLTKSNEISIDFSSKEDTKLFSNFIDSIPKSDLKTMVKMNVITGFKSIQRRRHKKKRINKKWAKKYGFYELPTTEEMEVEIVDIERDFVGNIDGSFTFDMRMRKEV